MKTFVRGGMVVLQIHDNGDGIRAENLPHIFEPFFTTKGFDGTGMGLASSFGIVRRHRGDIRALSEEGEGATFMVTLPRAKEVSQRTPIVPKGLSTGLRILVIDDNEQLVSVLKSGLETCKQEVFVALSGAEGIKIFGNHSVDIVICDLGMPGMNGWEVCKRLRALCLEKELRKPPFIILTGWGDMKDKPHFCSESGVDLVVEKPVAIPELLKFIGDLADH